MNTTTPYLNRENLITITETIKFIASILAPLVAGYIGIKYGQKQMRMQKRMDIIEKQLNEFYSPILCLRTHIRANGDLRVKIKTLGDDAWQEACKDFREGSNKPDITPYTKEIEYNNKKLKEIFIPQYNEMLKIFREKYWLAEPETRKFYPQLLEYVEIWNRNFNDGLPPQVAMKIDHTENNIKPFYDELEIRINNLRNELLKK